MGKKYRTGIYSKEPRHLEAAQNYITQRADRDKIAVEVLPLTNYIKSAEEHQDRLERCPNDYCHIPKEILHKYR